MPHELQLNWSTAAVKKGKLRLEVAGSPPPDWRGRFERSATLLHGGSSDWGEVTAKKNGVEVASVTPGSEEKLRHFLEGVVQQVNAAAEEEQERERVSEAALDDSPDGEMTQRFRGFADEGPAGDDGPDEHERSP